MARAPTTHHIAPRTTRRPLASAARHQSQAPTPPLFTPPPPACPPLVTPRIASRLEPRARSSHLALHTSLFTPHSSPLALHPSLFTPRRRLRGGGDRAPSLLAVARRQAERRRPQQTCAPHARLLHARLPHARLLHARLLHARLPAPRRARASPPAQGVPPVLRPPWHAP